MIRQTIDIATPRWRVYAYYAVDCYYTEEITARLVSIGCRGQYLTHAIKNMGECTLNRGLCYSNNTTGESVMVVGLASSPEETIDSFTHELHHLVCHICNAQGIDINSEKAAYLCGDLARAMYGEFRQTL